jgi:hypothetical protein
LKYAENCKLLTDADMGDTEENIYLMMELEEHPETLLCRNSHHFGKEELSYINT